MDSRRALVIMQNLSYPAFAGRDLRNWQNINGLASLCEVGVFGLHSNDPRVAKSPPVSLAFWRTSTDSALTYPFPTKKLEARGWLLDPSGHPSDLYYSEAAAREIVELMDSFKPQLVVVEGIWLHRYIDLFKRHRSRVILDLHSVEAAMFQQIADSTSGNDLQAKMFRHVLPQRATIIEQKAVRAADQIWVCSNEDCRLIKELYEPLAPIFVVPNAVDVDAYQTACTRMDSDHRTVSSTAKVLLFPASFQWEPNAACAKFLIDVVLPRLLDIFPDCRLMLAGSAPTSYMVAAAAREPRIVVTDTISDMMPFFAAASVVLVPLRQGSGTRFKILEAFAAGVPVISTKKGAEGLDVRDRTHLLFAESDDQFVDAVGKIWLEEGLASRLVANGLELVRRSYSWPAIGSVLNEAVEDLGRDN